VLKTKGPSIYDEKLIKLGKSLKKSPEDLANSLRKNSEDVAKSLAMTSSNFTATPEVPEILGYED
jgi:hypothetical protein